MGSKTKRKIVMKKSGCRYEDKTFDVPLRLSKDNFLEKKRSACCDAKMIRIAGSLKCLKCDKYSKEKT